jgi:tetratricopeptide (TPR) repeat protein
MDLELGMGIPSGTLIQAKSNYTIVYGSNNYNDVIAESGARIRLNKSPKGESVSVCQGKVSVKVKNITGFYYVRDCGGNITLASKSTEYSVDVRSNGVYYETTKGQTQVYQKQRLGLSPQQGNRRQNRELTGVSIAPQYEGNSGSIDPNNLPVNPDITSFDQAILTYEQMLQTAGNNPELALDENVSLAYLYMDSGRYGEAVDKLEEAISLLDDIDPYDAEMGILYLDLAEALKFGNYEYESELKTAIDYLVDEQADVNEEITYAMNEGDVDYVNDLRSELSEIQEDLYWAYSLND